MANYMIEVSLSPEEAQFILVCIKGCPIQATVEAMPKIVALVGSIARKLTLPKEA
jgi:hypothetical protein